MVGTPRLTAIVSLGFAAILASGCRLAGRSDWRAPPIAAPRSSAAALAAGPVQPALATPAPAAGRQVHWVRSLRPALPPPELALAAAEREYATALEQRDAGSAGCVDNFFRAAVHCWQAIEQTPSLRSGAADHRPGQLYRSSLQQLIETGQQFGRLDPTRGLSVTTPNGAAVAPITYHGFDWSPEDFNRLIVVGDYNSPALTRVHRRTGWGVPLVVLRERSQPERFIDRIQPFAATVLLRAAPEAISAPPGSRAFGNHPTGSPSPTAILEFYNPTRFRSIPAAGGQIALAADLTAPFAWLLNAKERGGPESAREEREARRRPKLLMLEPHRPGRTPIVFVHGLLSDPLTWVSLANDLRSVPWFNNAFEIWAFRYPTGGPFLRSAAVMRRECRAAHAMLASRCADPALDQMVLIGHSMGGLVSKLQVTYSGGPLWDAVSNQPLETIRGAPADRQELQSHFLFEPLPFVAHVVFIGTPHNGSSWASRLIGRVGSLLVTPAPEQQAFYERLVAANPNALRRRSGRRLPTSIDLLEPDSPVLAAIGRLPVDPRVQLHTIVGTGRSMLADGPADGVVPVESARHPGVVTERFVQATHRELPRRPETVEEVLAILKQQAAQRGVGSACGWAAQRPLAPNR